MGTQNPTSDVTLIFMQPIVRRWAATLNAEQVAEAQTELRRLGEYLDYY